MYSRTGVKYYFLCSVAFFLFSILLLPASFAEEGDSLREKLLAQGSEAMFKSTYTEAIKYYTKAITMFPEDANGYFMRAQAYDKNKEHAKAVADLEAAINIDWSFNNPSISKLLIGILTPHKSLRKAAIERYCEDFEASGPSWRNLVLALLREMEGDPAEALNVLQTGLSLYGANDIPQFYRMTLAHMEALNGKYEQALVRANKLLQETPRNAAFYLCRARIYMLMGQKDKAFVDCNYAIENRTVEVKIIEKLSKIIDLDEDPFPKKDRDELFDLYDYREVFIALYNLRSVLYEDRGELDNAVSDMHKSLSLLQTEKAYLRISDLYNKNGQIEKALFYLREAIDLNDQNPETYMKMAQYLYELVMYEESRDAVQKALKLDPEYPEALYILARLETPSLGFASEICRKAGINGMRRCRKFLEEKNMKKTVDMYMLTHVCLENWAYYHGTIYKLLESVCKLEGSLDYLVELADKKLAEDEDEITYHFLKAIAYGYCGQKDKAYESIRLYEKGIQLKPMGMWDNAPLFYSLIDGDEAAIKYCTRKLNEQKLSVNLRVETLITRAMIFSSMREYQKAINDYEQALKVNVDPDKAEDIQYGLLAARVDNSRASGKPEDSIKYLNKRLALNPEDFDALMMSAAFYADKGEYDKALENYFKVLDIYRANPGVYAKDPVTLPKIAEVYLAQGRLEEGLEKINELAKSSFNQPYVFLARALLYQAMGQPDKAFADLERVKDFDPQVYYRNCGNIYMSIGKFAQAIKNFDDYLKLDSSLVLSLGASLPVETTDVLAFIESAPNEISKTLAFGEIAAAFYFYDGQKAKALDIYRSLISRFPKSQMLRLQPLELYIFSEDMENAKKEARACDAYVSSNPVNTAVRERLSGLKSQIAVS